ncbi:hypothetical protein ACWD6I_22385 [Streptomyces sp. NPDC002454]
MNGTDRPLLLVGSTRFDRARERDDAWGRVAARSGGRVRTVYLPGGHWVFTDYAALLPALQAAGLLTAARRAALTGPAPAAVSVAAVRRAVRGFFARHLVRC